MEGPCRHDFSRNDKTTLLFFSPGCIVLLLLAEKKEKILTLDKYPRKKE
ncbi:hypothetical protein KAR10_02030 [bacterium]|nr:hypothetical protein [bacterium]